MKIANGLTWTQASNLSKAQAAAAGQIPALVRHIFTTHIADEVYDFTEGGDRFPQRIYVQRVAVQNDEYSSFLAKVIANPNFAIVNDGSVRFNNRTRPAIGTKIYVEVDSNHKKVLYPFILDENGKPEYLVWFSSDYEKMGNMIYNAFRSL